MAGDFHTWDVLSFSLAVTRVSLALWRIQLTRNALRREELIADGSEGGDHPNKFLPKVVEVGRAVLPFRFDHLSRIARVIHRRSCSVVRERVEVRKGVRV